jgi:hypothetical protein
MYRQQVFKNGLTSTVMGARTSENEWRATMTTTTTRQPARRAAAPLGATRTL